MILFVKPFGQHLMKKQLILASCVVAGLGLATLGQKNPGEDSLTKSLDRVLDAYQRVMNDQEVLDKGLMGSTRVISEPAAAFHGSAGAKLDKSLAFSISDSASQSVLRKVLAEARGLGFTVEHGIIRTKKPPKRENGRSFFASDNGVFSFMSSSYSSKKKEEQPEELEMLGSEALKAISSGKSPVFSKTVMNVTFRAKPIRFAGAKCASCHQGAFVGEVAAIAAVWAVPKK